MFPVHFIRVQHILKNHTILLRAKGIPNMRFQLEGILCRAVFRQVNSVQHVVGVEGRLLQLHDPYPTVIDTLALPGQYLHPSSNAAHRQPFLDECVGEATFIFFDEGSTLHNDVGFEPNTAREFP